MAPEDLRALAAADNAAWCDRVCRSHGLTPTTGDCWTSTGRTPPFYPDAVTLRPGLDPAAVLRRIDAGPGSSVKDSFADLDLAPAGFEVLFEARWLHRPPSAASATARAWTAVEDPGGLASWQQAHGTAPALRPALLGDPGVRVLARWEDGAVVAGAVASCSGAAVGVSNVFAGDLDQAWRELPEVVSALFPGLPLVGCERGDALVAATTAGFTQTGPLRVWLRGEPEEPGSGAVCWLERVCDSCGALEDGPPAATCPRCGTPRGR